MPENINSQIYNCYQQVYLNISYIDRYKRKKKVWYWYLWIPIYSGSNEIFCSRT